jgi:ABC-type nitrate/sulfonate/bicarbonate transport system permease component
MTFATGTSAPLDTARVERKERLLARINSAASWLVALGLGWMVLIAAEMLAQNPGLGKFVWDEFQNGSSASLARIMVAVLTIGIIGFALDRIMFALQSALTFSANR